MLKKTDLESNLLRIHEWIRTADQKVSIFLTFQGVILAIIFPDVFSWVSTNIKIFSDIDLVTFISAVVLIGYSLYKSTSVIIPRLNKDKEQKSITYFGDIANFKLTDFKKRIKQTSEEDYENEIIEQIYISSKIALRKHLQFKDVIFTFFIGIFLLIVDFFIFKINI
jgi:hypothetical protein